MLAYCVLGYHHAVLGSCLNCVCIPHFVLLEVGDNSEFENEMDVSLDDPRDVLSDAPFDDGEKRQARKQHVTRQRYNEPIDSKSSLKQYPTKSSQPSQQVS